MGCNSRYYIEKEKQERLLSRPNVCFPCATIHDPDTGRIALYYGTADSYVSLAFTKLDNIIDYIKEHSVLTDTDTEAGIC